VERLPLFPLPVVLFPGTRMPLHIFEPRYRRMLRDCMEGDRRFGLIYRSEDDLEVVPSAGTIGCIARVDNVETLPDGRSNIIVDGVSRFLLHTVAQSSSAYLVAEVAPFVDDDEPVPQLTALALRLGELFADAAVAAQSISDDSSSPIQLPDDPRQIAFTAAAAIELDAPVRQRILSSSSPSGRIREIITLLDASLPSLKERAEVHERAKTNGHGATRSV
jgi:Lon protease-like protein